MGKFKPPFNIALRNPKIKTVFLAGTIDLGNSEDWQTKYTKEFNNRGFNVFNPRRDDWDASWKQEFENPQFYQQVNWELNALDQSDLIVMYFDPESKSPISLLELGLYAKSGKIRVICPEGFCRKGNVDIVCNRFNIPLYVNWENLFIDLETY